jgi:hypothetical protein
VGFRNTDDLIARGYEIGRSEVAHWVSRRQP